MNEPLNNENGQQIPDEYQWLKPGVKVRHVMMGTDNLWEAASTPQENKEQTDWEVKIKEPNISVPCDVLLKADDAPLQDEHQGFPDPIFGIYFVGQRDDGAWECCHGGADVTVIGATEKEALKRMILSLDEAQSQLIGSLWEKGGELVKLKRARAVLAEHKEGVEQAKRIIAEWGSDSLGKDEPMLMALVALADALEGGGDE